MTLFHYAAIALLLCVAAGELDQVALLQGQVETARVSIAASEDTDIGYDLAGTLACASKEPVALKKSPSVVERSRPAALSTRIQPLRLTPGTDDEDPAGANALRAVLELMIIALIFDGMRRWHLQKQQQKALRKVAIADPAEEAKAAWVALFNAAGAGDEAAFAKVMQCNPAISETDTWGCTALHFAAAGGSTVIATELLKRGAKVDAVDAMEETPLHFAARAGHVGLCECLLAAGAKVDAVNLQDMTPFVVSGHANQASTCSFLADRGAGCAGMADEDLPPLVQIQLVRKVIEACAPH